MDEIEKTEVDPWLRQILAANVRRLREARGLSQEKLSVECGFHRTYVSQVERAVTNITIDNLQKLAEGLGAKPQILLTA